MLVGDEVPVIDFDTSKADTNPENVQRLFRVFNAEAFPFLFSFAD